MAKTSVTDWSDIAGNNLDIDGINLSENMPPSYVNNAMREMMAQIKQWKDGEAGVYQSQTVQNLKVNGNANILGMLSLNGSQGNTGQVLTSNGTGLAPRWDNAFVKGMIMIWYGEQSSVPTGWAVCSGSGDTPDLRSKFVIGAGNYSPNNTGGKADATLVSHTHTGTTNTVGDHVHMQTGQTLGPGSGGFAFNNGGGANLAQNTKPAGAHSHTLNISSEGSSATNANLPPFMALFYIMKL